MFATIVLPIALITWLSVYCILFIRLFFILGDLLLIRSGYRPGSRTSMLDECQQYYARGRSVLKLYFLTSKMNLDEPSILAVFDH
jgi:hypothetical protein